MIELRARKYKDGVYLDWETTLQESPDFLYYVQHSESQDFSHEFLAITPRHEYFARTHAPGRYWCVYLEHPDGRREYSNVAEEREVMA